MVNPPASKNVTNSPYRRKNQCGLLVSVRDYQEAQLCLQDNVDILDLKEPSAGALGAVPDLVIEQVQQLAKKVPAEKRPKLSFALGELVDWDFKSHPRMLDRYCSDKIAGMSYAKIGLAGVDQLEDWRAAWRQLFADLPESIQPVVVGYLDRLSEQTTETESIANNRCPSIEQLIDFAKSHTQVETVLLDTCDKQNDLFASVDDQQLQDIIATANRAGLACVVAGSVGINSLQRVIQAGANLVGVRGAVCDGDRSGRLCEQKLIDFCRRMAKPL